MSRHLSPLAAKLHRELLQRPGFTRLPVCGACGREVQPRDFGREHCKACEAERAAVSEAWEAERWAEANPGASLPVPSEPMFGSAEAERPFLIEDEDEHKPSPARRAYQRRSSRTGSPYTGQDERRADRRGGDEDYWTRQQRLAEDAQAHDAAEEWDRNEVAEHSANEPTEGEEGPF